MRTLRRFAIALAVSVIGGGVVATAANAAKPAQDVEIDQRTALTILASAVDLDGDAITGSIIFGDVVGSPGKSQTRGFTEFGDVIIDPETGSPVGAGPDCGDFDVQLPLVTAMEGSAPGYVQTFEDLSQLFVEFTSGHLCASVIPFPPFADTGSGFFVGKINGGTGRFAGATGDVTLENVLTLNVNAAGAGVPPTGAAVATGTIVGTIVLP
jgi:hypothetical protein